MTPHFLPSLVNGPFQDPGLYLDFVFSRRAILFDLGDLSPLSARKILRISDICISHTHIDHFIGFDRMLRIMLGRDRKVRLYGPPGLLEQVGHRLASYNWNLLGSYPTEFCVEVRELHPDGSGRCALFSSRRTFAPEPLAPFSVPEGVIRDEENLRIRCAFLEHSTPSLAYAFEEKLHVNIRKNRLAELGLPVGPWLGDLKRAVLRGEPDHTPVRAWWSAAGGGIAERIIELGELKRDALTVVPGEKVAYVTDAAFTPQNRERIVELARGADYFFIEATFLHREKERARERAHLTAMQAGELARLAQAARVIPFHFSPRHEGEEQELRRELDLAFEGGREESIP